ncbi:hypothetical protein ABH920_007904 [Catenulispora sp. EB89]|uniref:hypothetical protein n=1 Tax=Catenulispora sp. EB89 TaxID=3156257 RepID=UPI0035191121
MAFFLRTWFWRVLGIAALALLATATATVGLVTPLVMLGIALVGPGITRQATIRLRRAPVRLRARQAFIEAEAAKSCRKLFRRGNSQPKQLRKAPSTQPSATPFTARPTVVYNVAPGEYSRTCSELTWTGTALTLTDRRGATLTWTTIRGGVLRGTRLRPYAPAPDLGDLLVAELVVTKPRLLPLDRVHLLDRWSRRLTTVAVVGFTEDDLAALAAHAGVAFTLYEIPSRVKATPETLVAALFPRSVRYRRPAGIGPEWRWLERVRLVARILKAMAEDSLWDPQADLAARRAGSNRRW